MENKKLVLAYSGGLDTSYCIKYLSQEKGYEVHAVTADTGGFSKEELIEMEQRAHQLGAVSFQAIDVTPDFYQQCLRYLVYGNVLRYQTYPLSVSAERSFQAIAIAQHARQIGAKIIAHGSTGAGNDQVRFDLVFQVLIPDVEIITPIRDQSLSRAEEITYLAQHGIQWPAKKGKYSINAGIWGTSVGGAQTLTSHLSLPEEAWPQPVEKTESQTIQIHFKKGELTGINDHLDLPPLTAYQKLESLAAPYGIGRDIHVGDTVIGIKGRVGFAAAAPLITIKAHHLLEKHTLGKWQLYWKEQLANWYGMLLHEGQFLDPVMRNIEAFLDDTQSNVTGQVDLVLHPYRFELTGIQSDFDLMQVSGGQYGEATGNWTGEDVKGFTKILALPIKLQQSLKENGHV